jgi:inner membrane protein
MDTITHIALGACAGEILLGKKLGKRAMLLGAVANSIPDIDFVASFWMSPANNLLAHRGFTHSFLFAIIVTPFLALYAEYVHRPHNISMQKWIAFFGIQILLHLLVDAFNAYGIGWFEPFSHYRISFNAIFVADPFFSLWLGIAFVALLVLKRKSRKRRAWAYSGIVLSSLYLSYCLVNKFAVDKRVTTQLAAQKINYKNYFTTPTPLNNLLWYVVAANDSGYYIGYASVFDKKKNIGFHFFPQNDSLLRPVSNHEDLQHLIRFSRGFYTVEKWKDTLVFNDLRFGQITGWQNVNAHFVFHYYLQHPAEDNKLVIQRGRFENWNYATVASLIKRIEGN